MPTNELPSWDESKPLEAGNKLPSWDESSPLDLPSWDESKPIAPSAEDIRERLYAPGSTAIPTEEEAGTLFRSERDRPLVSKVGGFLQSAATAIPETAFHLGKTIGRGVKG